MTSSGKCRLVTEECPNTLLLLLALPVQSIVPVCWILLSFALSEWCSGVANHQSSVNSPFPVECSFIVNAMRPVEARCGAVRCGAGFTACGQHREGLDVAACLCYSTRFVGSDLTCDRWNGEIRGT